MKKTNIFKTLIIGAAFCFAGLTANAQFEFGLSLSGGIPTGDLGKKVEKNAAGLYGNSHGLMGKEYITQGSSASIGFNFRFGYRIPINNSEYGEVLPFVEFGGQFNFLKKDIKEQYTTRGDTYPRYINIPMYIGAQYRYPVTDVIKPYVEFGIGYNMLLITVEKNKAGDVYHYKNPSGAFSGNVGLGCFFSDYVSVGVYYYGLGTHAIKFTNDNNTVTDPIELANTNAKTHTLGTVAFRLNFHFGMRR